MSKAKKKSAAKKSDNAPLVVDVTIDDQGTVQVEPECVLVTKKNQKIRWKLNPASAKNWRLVGLCWCGDTQPPADEFHEWNNEKARITVTDRNTARGDWPYGILYREKKAPKGTPPRVFDPIISNDPR